MTGWTSTTYPTCAVVEPVRDVDTTVFVSIYREGDGPSVLLPPEQARAMAAELTRAADTIDPPTSGRIATVYMRRGPAIEEGELVEYGAATERGLPELLRGLADDIEQGADTTPEAD